MPRRDGFPTNREMLVDFNTTAHQAFVGAYDRWSIHPAFQDKPLAALRLSIINKIPEGIVSSEKLSLGVVDEDITAAMGDLGFNLPQDVIDRYVNIATSLADVALTQTLRLRPIVPPEGVAANYVAQLSTGRTRQVDTFKERPSKMTLAAAKFYAERALAYTESDAFDVPDEIKTFYYKNSPDADSVMALSHRFNLEHTPDLPLNGYESWSFLEAYRAKMKNGRERSRNYLEQLPEGIRNSAYGEGLKDRMAAYDTALKRVNEVIERKSD